MNQSGVEMQTFIISENKTIQKLLIGDLHQTWPYKSFWGNRHNSECFACGSLIGPGWAAGPSDAPRTASLPADWETGRQTFAQWQTQLLRKVRSNLSTSAVWHLQWACSGEEASVRSPSGSSQLPAPGFLFEELPLWKWPVLSPCWPTQSENVIYLTPRWDYICCVLINCGKSHILAFRSSPPPSPTAKLYLLSDVCQSCLQLSAEGLTLWRALIQLPVTVAESFLLTCEPPHWLQVLLLQLVHLSAHHIKHTVL